MFLYQKLIDRSSLRQGFQIPVEFHHLLKMMPNGMPLHGQTRHIKVVIDGVGYDAQLKNQGFDRNKYDGHAEVIQIRYSEGSDLVKRLREVFSSTRIRGRFFDPLKMADVIIMNGIKNVIEIK